MENKESFRKVSLKAPDFLEEAFGYERDRSRFVAFWWTPAGDELYCSDEQGYGATVKNEAWLLLMRHPLGNLLFRDCSFGSSDEEGAHCLLLDRKTRNLWVGDRDEVIHFLHDRRPSGEVVAMSEEEWADFNRELMGQISDGESTIQGVSEAAQREHELCERLEAWLDDRLSELIENTDAIAALPKGGSIWLEMARFHLAMAKLKGPGGLS